jgi:4-amino-4-deoxy-L-arabinose transferase-like glycosyltransferase
VAASLGALVIVAAALRLYSYQGHWGADDGEYALLANAMAHGRFWEFVDENYIRAFNAPAHLPYRFALVVPLALLFKAFGVSELTFAAYPFVLSLLGVLVAFACGRVFFGATAGLLAAALWTVAPLDIAWATFFLPDGIASFYACVGVLAVVYVMQSAIARPAQLLAGGMVAGLCFGLSWMAKESVAYLVPFCGVLIVAGARKDFRRTLPLWVGVAIASGAVLAAEMAYYAIVRGDLLLRVHENERSFQQTKAYLFYEGSRFGWPEGGSRAKALVKRLFISGPSDIFLNPQFLAMPLVAMLALARAAYWRDRAFFVPGVWMVSLVLMYNFGSPSSASYAPLVLLDRYLYPILLPAIVLTAGLIARLMSRESSIDPNGRERRFWGGIVAAGLALITAAVTAMEVRDLERVKPMYAGRDVTKLVRPDQTIYTDPLSAKSLAFYWKFPPSSHVVNFEGMTGDAIPPGSFVLVDKSHLNWLDVNVSMWLTSDYGYHEPDFSVKAPESWKVVWRNVYATLYHVN